MLSSIVSTVTQFPNSAMGTTVNDGAQTGSRGVQGAPPAEGAFFYFYFFYFFIFSFWDFLKIFAGYCRHGHRKGTG